MKALFSIQTKLFFSILIIILLSYSSLIYISLTVQHMDAPSSEEMGRGPAEETRNQAVQPSRVPAPPHGGAGGDAAEEVDALRSQHLWNILLSAVLSVMFSFAAAYLAARKLTRPLRELIHGAQRIEVGDFNHRVTVTSSDEFGTLASSFNRMVDALKEREATIKRKTLDLEVLNKYLQELNEQLEFKVAERTCALRMEMGRLEAILTSMAEGVIVTDRENRVILFNPTAQKIFDLLPYRVIGEDLEKICDMGGFCQLIEVIREIQRENFLAEGREVELDVKGKKLRVSLSHLTDQEWEFGGVVMSVRDVTLEEEVDRMKTDFISTVSHELKTPLTSIKGSLQLILRRGEAFSETERELLSICLRNTDRLIRLIGDILDLSKIESGKLELRFNPESIGRLVAEAIEEIAGFARNNEVSIVNNIAEEIPPVYGEHDRLFQVITNLLSNAVKFSPEGKVITVNAEREDDFVAVSVTDQGKSIKRSERDKLFKRFQQLGDPESRERGGTGLGLAICKEIVERHHGRIYYRPKQGGGNIFTFTVPIYEEQREKRKDSYS